MRQSDKKRSLAIDEHTTSLSPISISMQGEETEFTLCLGKRAKAILFDTSSSAVHKVHIELMEESALTYVSLSTSSVRRFSSELHEGASIRWHCTTLGATPDSHTLSSTLLGRNTKSDIDWIFRVQGTEKQKISIRNIFDAENGGGEITLKGVASESASAACNGMIEITERGSGTNTYLTEDVLMLDPTAKIDAIPGLEIRTNDVKASHSATVRRVTPEDLFYFQSRGIDQSTARAMYVEGFLTELLERIPDIAVQSRVMKTLGTAS